ncbi:MAG: protein kinase domain-containing protein [Opitutales bacterium]
MGDNPSRGRVRQVRQIFEDALELDPGARLNFIDRACGGDSGLQADVNALLSGNSFGAGELDRLAREVLGPRIAELGSDPALARKLGDVPDEAGELREGAAIGSYKLLRLIGKGGFGSVWKAQQVAPVKRLVAIKFLKLGVGSRQILERFEAERQTLAMMQHPNIAQVFDAGQTPAGRSYFVMELVGGVPMVEFCQRHRLTLASRLRLLMEVCSAVQHAHQKGIIHRDLKPGNILVHFEDGTLDRVAIPKIIDFGVAKALTLQLSEELLESSYGQIIGTPVYMSPEQADLDGTDIDTRSDIYSLGVMLYELITDGLPFEEHISEHPSFGQYQRIIREVEPPRPSSRLRRLHTEQHERLGRTLEGLSCDYPSLRRALHSDLDWVVLRCLEKDRNRRYETAHGLALDIGRFLEGKPLNAGPPTARYRILKYVGRHRRGFLAIAFMFVCLLLGLVGTSLGFISLKRAQQLETMERQRAEEQARELQAVIDFQRLVFERMVPEDIGSSIFNSILNRFKLIMEGEGKPAEEVEQQINHLRTDLQKLNPTDIARQTFNEIVLARSSDAVADGFSTQPAVEAALRESLATAFLQMGLPGEARLEQERAFSLRIANQGKLHPVTLETGLGLAMILLEQKRYGEAQSLLMEMHTASRELPGISPEFIPRLLFALGQAQHRLGNWDSAEEHLEAALERYRVLYANDHPLTVRAELERIHAMRHFDYHVSYNSLHNNADMVMVALQQESLFGFQVDRTIELFGEDDPLVWQSRHSQAESLVLQTFLPVEVSRQDAGPIELCEQAIAILQKVADSQSRVLGQHHPRTKETHETISFVTDRLRIEANRRQ